MKAEDVVTRQDFIKFLKEMNRDFKMHVEETKGKKDWQIDSHAWANLSSGAYLEAMASWLSDGEKTNELCKKHTLKDNLNWKDLAVIIYSGKLYE